MEKSKIPYSEDAEIGVLGCILLDPSTAQAACGMLSEDDFYMSQCKTLFQAITDIVSAGGLVDAVTLGNRLQEKKQFDTVGGSAFLSKIAMSVGSSVKLKYYAEDLHRLAYFRQAIKRGRDMVEAGFGRDADKLMGLSQAEDVMKTEELETIPDVFGTALAELAEKRKMGGLFSGLPTGFTDLDFYLGGLQDATLVVLAARPAMGKTALALDILRNATKRLKGENKISVFFSLEMNKKQIAFRIFSAESRIENSNFSIRPGDDEAWEKTLERIKEDAETFERNTGAFYIDDTSGISLEQMYAKCHNLRGTTGKELGLVVVDYLQLMGGGKGASREQDVSAISRGLKKLSKDFNCPVLALSQLSRVCEQRPDHRPVLSDLRESGAIEQDADVVTFLYRDEYYFPDTEKKNQAELIIAKHRQGPTGVVDLAFIGEYTTFRNLEKWTPNKKERDNKWDFLP